MVHGPSILDTAFGKCSVKSCHIQSYSLNFINIHHVSRSSSCHVHHVTSCPCRVAESMALFSAGAGTWRPPLMSPEPLEPRTRLVSTAQHGAERPRGWSEMSQKAVARSNRQRHLWTRGLHDLHVPVVNPPINLPWPYWGWLSEDGSGSRHGNRNGRARDMKR